MNTAIMINDYHCSIAAAVPVQEAFNSICHVSAWWATHVEGRSEKLGDSFTVRFGETFVTFKIAERIPGQKLVWQVTDCNLHWLKDKKEWNGTFIVWEVSSRNGLTQVDMTHLGLIPGIECYDQCESGWNHFIKESLFKLLTEKKGIPGR